MNNLTFPTKSAQQEVLDRLNRRYGAAREEISKLCLAVMHAEGETPAAVEALYWALPFDLHNYRAKHGAQAVAVFPEAAPVVALIEQLFAERAEVKAAPVVKVAKVDKSAPAVVAAASKTQTRGNCPCCGREQAVLASGRMSQHGYTVEHGWFNGVCSGDRYAPMQVQREVTDQIVASVREDVKKLENRAADLRAGRETLGLIAMPGEYVRHGQKPTMVQWAELNEYKQAEALRNAVAGCESRARAGAGFANDMEALVNAVHGTALKVVALD